MPRRVRIEFEGAIYHVMARGHERKAIFRDDHDRKRFLETLAEAVPQFGLLIHAWCLMPNHYHLVAETPRGNLSRAMGWVQTTYTARFNARHRRSGHLFQGRFKAQLVDGSEYGKWLVQYVHYNPVRPRDRREPIPQERKELLDGYEWSSHRDYAGLRKPSQWLCVEWLRLWGGSKGGGATGVSQGDGGGVWEAGGESVGGLKGGLVLGADDLWEKAKQLIGRKEAKEEVRWKEREGAGMRGSGCGRRWRARRMRGCKSGRGCGSGANGGRMWRTSSGIGTGAG